MNDEGPSNTKHSGSSFDDSLDEEGIRECVDAVSLRRLVRYLLGNADRIGWPPDKLSRCQKLVCAAFRTDFVPIDRESKIGIAMATKGLVPLNGLRHPPTVGTSGWYIWWGEQLSTDDDFFVPLHARHFFDEFLEPAALLGLAPGSRFIWTMDCLDVWNDPSLLNC